MINSNQLVTSVMVGLVILVGWSGAATGAAIQQSIGESSGATVADTAPQVDNENEGEVWTVTITRVIDGDTVEAQFPNGEVETLRLLGVDTPETTLSRVNPDEFEGIPNTTEGRDHLFNWSERATEYTTDNLSGESVQIQVDPQADRRDSFNRLLVYVYQDSESFNKELLSEGYARMYDTSFSERDEFEVAESNARENNTGLWDFAAAQTADTGTSEDSEEESSESLPPMPANGDYDCSHFDSHSQAQTVLERQSGDPHRLDADSDGISCESLR